MVFAPGLFSTTGWPHAGCSLSASWRAITSMPPPGGYRGDAHRLRRPGLAEAAVENASSTGEQAVHDDPPLVLIMMQAMKIVIVGGGIGGLSLARELALRK